MGPGGRRPRTDEEKQGAEQVPLGAGAAGSGVYSAGGSPWGWYPTGVDE